MSRLKKQEAKCATRSFSCAPSFCTPWLRSLRPPLGRTSLSLERSPKMTSGGSSHLLSSSRGPSSYAPGPTRVASIRRERELKPADLTPRSRFSILPACCWPPIAMEAATTSLRTGSPPGVWMPLSPRHCRGVTYQLVLTESENMPLGPYLADPFVYEGAGNFTA